MSSTTERTAVEDRTAYDRWDDDYRVQFSDNGDHIAIMSFRGSSKFLRINITREDFDRIAALVQGGDE